MYLALKYLIGPFPCDILASDIFPSSILVYLNFCIKYTWSLTENIQHSGSKMWFRMKAWFRKKYKHLYADYTKLPSYFNNTLYYKLLKTKVQEANLTKEKFRKVVSELTIHGLGVFHLSSISMWEIFNMEKIPYIVCSLLFVLSQTETDSFSFLWTEKYKSSLYSSPSLKRKFFPRSSCSSQLMFVFPCSSRQEHHWLSLHGLAVWTASVPCWDAHREGYQTDALGLVFSVLF